MRRFYRWMRKGLASLFVLAVLGSVLYYLVFTLTGIFDEIEQRARIRDRDAFLVQTATSLAPTVAAESVNLASFGDGTVPEALPTAEIIPPTEALEVAAAASATPDSPSAAPTDTSLPPADTVTPLPSDTSTPEPSATPLPSDTPQPTATATPVPTDSETPLPTATDTTVPTEAAQRATLIPTNTLRPTTIPTNTPRPTFTPSPTPTFTLTPTLTFTPSLTPTDTLTPTATSTYTATSTPTNTATPTPTFTPSNTPTPTPSPYPIEGTYATPVTTPIISFPPRAPLVEDDPDIVNIVMLGSDSYGDNIGRNDVIILVSVNKREGSAAMWHIPRDLLVYIPGYTVDRINLAYQLGYESGWPGGPAELVKETILYNFGIEVDYYARVNFTDFTQVIEQIGGLEISVDCQIEDWALISPDMDIYDEASYERYTMRIGRQTLTPYYALWYARSRVSTSDIDRGRRQMDVLRAIFSQARGVGILTQVTDLWPEVIQIVDTDMELTDVLDFVPLASSLELNKIERYSGILGRHYENFTTPDDGRAVLIPNYEALYQLAQDFVTPPTGNRVDRINTRIEVYDASAYGIGFDLVASDRLAWEGFSAAPMGQIPGVRREVTTIYDYTGSTKGSALDQIMQVMRVGPSNVVSQPDPNRTVDFRIEIGTGYNSCLIGTSADEVDIERLTGEDEEVTQPAAEPIQEGDLPGQDAPQDSDTTPQTVG